MPKVFSYHQNMRNRLGDSYTSHLIDNNRITKRVVQYRDDPDKASALAEVKRLSMRARKNKDSSKKLEPETENQGKDIKNSKNEEKIKITKKEEIDEKEGVLKEGNEKNKEDEKEKEENKQTEIGNIKNINEKNHFYAIIQENKPEIFESQEIDKIKGKKTPEDEEKEEVEKLNIKNRKRVHFGEKKNNTIENIKTNKYNDNGFTIKKSNLKVLDDYLANKKQKLVGSRYNKSRNYNINMNSDSFEKNYVKKFNSVDDGYDVKKDTIIEKNHHKDKIIVNEYHTRSTDKRNLKKYKTEYVWDKNINRIVEKRIYSDEENDNNTKNNMQENNVIENNKNDNNIKLQDNNDKEIYVEKEYEKNKNEKDTEEKKIIKKEDFNKEKIKVNLKGNKYNYNNKINKKDEEKKKENKVNQVNDNIEKEENNEKLENIDKEENINIYNKKDGKLLELTIEKTKREKIDPEILKGKDKRVLEMRKRFGNSKVIFRKEQKLLKNNQKDEKEKNKEKKLEQDDYKIIGSTRGIQKELNKTNDHIRFYRRGRKSNEGKNPQKENEKIIRKEEISDYPRQNQNNTYSEIILKKKTIIEDGNKNNPKIETKFYNYNPDSKAYKKIPIIINDENEKKFINKSFERRRYKKRPSNQFTDFDSKVVYTKKIIEEKKPQKGELIYEPKEKKIRIQIMSENIMKEDDNIKDTNLQKYNKDSKYTRVGQVYLRSINTDDDFNGSGNGYKYRKKRLIPSYDDINDSNEDNLKKKINNTLEEEYEINQNDLKVERPYYKKRIKMSEIRGKNSNNDEDIKAISRTQDFEDN